MSADGQESRLRIRPPRRASPYTPGEMFDAASLRSVLMEQRLAALEQRLEGELESNRRFRQLLDTIVTLVDPAIPVSPEIRQTILVPPSRYPSRIVKDILRLRDHYDQTTGLRGSTVPPPGLDDRLEIINSDALLREVLAHAPTSVATGLDGLASG